MGWSLLQRRQLHEVFTASRYAEFQNVPTKTLKFHDVSWAVRTMTSCGCGCKTLPRLLKVFVGVAWLSIAAISLESTAVC